MTAPDTGLTAVAAATPRPFDLRDPLPIGVTVLEASAGTGKTWTIAALAARYVAEGLPLRSLLLVTFTRLATGELRERVRERLAVAERELAKALASGPAGASGPTGDLLVELLTEGSDEDRRLRHERLTIALAEFDAATISTIHGFCQNAVAGLGTLSEVDRDVTFEEDLRDLRNEIVDDFYLRKFRVDTSRRRAFPLKQAHLIARAALANPLAPLVPTDADPKSDCDMRFRFAEAVRTEMARRKRQQRVLTFDDQLSQLATALNDPVHGPAARRRLRSQYRVVLVDEFQDTDPVQWDIMWRAFGPAGPAGPAGSDANRSELEDGFPRALVLIGDPKQAIYAFRGADVQAYLDAVQAAGTQATLGTNWRSDEGLLQAYDELWHGSTLGDPLIAYRTVEAAPAHVAPRLVDAPAAAPLRVRVVHRKDKLVQTTPGEKWAQVGSTRTHILGDLAGQVVDLLGSNAHLVRRSVDGHDLGREPVHPGHLAVLVRANWQTAAVCEALADAGVPAVVNGAGSVFGAPVAKEWLALFEALERPASPTRVRAVARTCFIGWDIERIAAAQDDDWEQVHAKLHRWVVVLREYGVASLLERISHTESLPARLLAGRGGERRLTDLRHIGQLLHAESMASRLGLTSLTAWLRQRLADDDEGSPDDQTRRLESDADAVQVLTIHRSKGLEFPIVLFPFLWDHRKFEEDGPQLFHDAAHGSRLTLDVGLDGEEYKQHVQQALTEQRGEDLRLLYVALTRARHQSIVWWASSQAAGQSALGRVFAREPGSDIAPRTKTMDEEQLVTRLRGAPPGLIGVERTASREPVRWDGASAPARDLAVRNFARPLDLQWRRTSYTALTSDSHERGVMTEPEETGTTDEPVTDEHGLGLPATPIAAPEVLHDPTGAVLDPAVLPPVPLSAMPGGASVGSLVHAMFEHTDFQAADLTAELLDRYEREAWRQLDLGDPVALAAGLAAAIDTPLGPLVDDVALRDIPASDRLDELDFELPLVGGDVPTGDLSLPAIAALLRQHLPAADPLVTYADRLEQLGPDLLRGYLVGSIDLALRTRTADGTPRFTVVDYKTNFLGVPGEPLTAWHYRPAAMADAMQHAHYPLQALIYTVALHRYLRWRMPGYEPERNLGGVLYLFVRGMTGAEVPRVGDQPCGVFSWHPPAALVEALSLAFDAGMPA